MGVGDSQPAVGERFVVYGCVGDAWGMNAEAHFPVSQKKSGSPRRLSTTLVVYFRHTRAS